MGGRSINTSDNKLEALAIQSSCYGGVIAWLRGMHRIPGNLLWYGDFKATAHTESTGGKGGGGSTSTSYTYSASLVMGLCHGVISAVPLVWKGKATSGLSALGLSPFTGAVGQAGWSVLNGRGLQTLNYSGIAYVAAQAYELGGSASVENHSFEVRHSSAYSVSGSTPDVDPAAATYDLLTHPHQGAAFPAALIGDWTDWSNYCVAHGLLVSPLLTSQVAASEALQMMADLTNSAIVWSDGKLKVRPYGDAAATGNGRTYTPDTTPVFQLDDSCYVKADNEAPVKRALKTEVDCFNVISLQYRDRANGYNPAVVQAKDRTDIAANGARPRDQITADWICDGAVARLVAELRKQRDLLVLGTFTFRLPWHYAQLEVMDLVTLTDTVLQLLDVPARVTEISEDSDEELAITCEDYPAGVASAPRYAAQGMTGFALDANVAPGDALAPVIFELPGALTTTGLELAIASGSASADWGGCQVWVSYDGTTYRQLTELRSTSRYGTVQLDSTSSLQIFTNAGQQLLSGSDSDAANLATLFYVAPSGSIAGEYMAYETATLTAANAYTLAGMVRAAYGTASVTHGGGAPWVRVDEAIARSGPLDPALIGKTVYVKLTSFNVFGNGQQSLADVSATAYTITGKHYVLGLASSTLSIKLNVNDFAGTVNYNEAYIHGRDSSGAAVDAPGSILVNGVATPVPKGPLNSNFGPVAGYIMWDSAGSTFSVLGSSTRPYVLARRFQGQWQYDDNNSGSWTNFTVTATHYIIGTLESGGTDAGNPGSAPGLIAASIWAAAVTPNALVAVADAAYAAAAAAQSAADGAATNASAALARLTAIDSDGILSRGEKPEVIKAWQAISDEKPGIASKASDFSITTLRTAYIAAYDALASYLTALSPAWNDATADTPITPSTDLAAWTAYYDARQALLNETAAEAAKRANWGQIDSRPADSELLNSYVQVGGRNLLTRAAIGGTVTTDYFGGQNAAYLDLGAGGNWRMTPWTSHEVGDYSVSGWIKASVATNVDFDLCDLTPHTIAVTTAWQFFKLEGEFNSSTYLNTTYFGFLDFLSTIACRLTISNLKLETGTKATDWSPAPEDVDTRISAAQSDASTAIIAASDAQATADGKVTTFVQTSPPTAEGVGDLWIDSDDANKLYRWSGSAWVAIRDTGIAAALTDASNAQATADGKIVSFYQTSPPTASAVGDLWIDTDDSNKQYRWSGSAWVSIRDAGIAAAIAAAATAQSTADGKIDSFYQTSAPGSFSDGDIWFDTDDGNKQYVAVSGVWTVAADTRIGAAITAAAGAQATADGRVTTFYASSAPTANAVGDLWANTTSGSTRLSRWSGSAWVVLSVIGTADVDTAQLANQAATVVTLVTLTSISFSNIS